MSRTHDHGNPRDRNIRRLGITLGLVVLYMGAEVVGGLLSGSLALLADAGHMLSDAGSLALALFALWIARKPRSPERTFGYHRTEILAALANGATLVAIAIYIVVEAWHRLRDPHSVDGRIMLLVAVGGLAVNLAGIWLLHQGRDESLNIRGAWLHVLADTLGSAQAIVAGALIWVFGWNVVDPIAAVLIAVLVVWSSWTLLRDSVNILMEATPEHIDTREVKSALTSVEGIADVHDLHIWTITSGFESLSVHAQIQDGAVGRDRDRILQEIHRTLQDRFQIEHCTVQLEGAGCDADTCP